MTKEKKNQKTTHFKSKEPKKQFKYKFIKRKKGIKHIKPTSRNITSKSTKMNDSLNKKNKAPINIINGTKTNEFKIIENKYMEKLLNIYFDEYGDDYLNEALDRLNKNKKLMTETILNKFGLTEERRKYVLNYFGLFVDSHKIDYKLYFVSVSLFDSFLINFSETNTDEKCQQLFISKNNQQFSDIKLMLFIFCCYYIVAKFYNTNLLSINDLLKYPNATKEVTHDDLSNLIKEIIIYNDCNIDILNIYSFIELYMFEIRRCLKKFEWDNYENFVEVFEKSLSFLGAKIGKYIFFQSFEESIQALGIMIFCYRLCKYKYPVNSNIDNFVNRSLFNLEKALLKYYGTNKLSIIINWLNDNWNK